MPDLTYKNESFQIIGAAMEVYDKIPGCTTNFVSKEKVKIGFLLRTNPNPLKRHSRQVNIHKKLYIIYIIHFLSFL